MKVRGLKMSLHIVLHEPQIPPNTGNVARTCLATGTTLHLIHPLGFSTEDKMLKRAGLDYWKNVNIVEHENIESLYEMYPEGIFYYVENIGERLYTEADFSDDTEDLFFVFGKETAGIPNHILEANVEYCLRLPMTKDVRSLNLGNTCAIVLYEALRQRNFKNLF